jgi:hypothetical protein
MIETQIINLLELRDKAHLAHWATQSYAEHKALGKFYDGLLDLVDTFVETYQGKYGRLNLSGIAGLNLANSLDIVNEVYSVIGSVETKIDKECTDLLNIVADIKGLCNHTKYLLSLK